MATSNKVLNDRLRERYLSIISDVLTEKDEEVLRVGSNEIALPCLDDEGNEKFIVVTIKVPTGSRNRDESEEDRAYDGYTMQKEYEIKCKNKAESAKKKAEEKAKKIERDKKIREKKGE